jgi:cell division protein FtsW
VITAPPLPEAAGRPWPGGRRPPSLPTFRGPLTGQQPRATSGLLGADPWLVLAVAALLGLSIVMVFNVSYFYAQERFGDPLLFFRKHLLSIGLGLVAAFIAARLSSATYHRIAYPLLLVVAVMLVFVLVPGIGAAHGGARRWLHGGPLSFQPSEPAKFAVVLYLARSLVRHADRLASFKFGVLPHAAVAGVLAGLVLLEPDFGTAALVLGLLALMLFVGGVPVRYLVVPALCGLPLPVYAVMAEEYRLKRVLAFLNPDLDPLGVNFQLKQSFIAFGSGGLWGLGLGESRQKMFYLPEAHTDFIFSVVGEELGLAGAVLVLALFGVVAVRGFRIAMRHPERFGGLLAFGVTVALVLQGVINVAVVLGCLPTKGIALPFVSYGGSAMIAALGQTGVLLALSRESG